MKSKLLAFGLVIIALPSFAQDHTDSYNYSAFSHFHLIQPTTGRSTNEIQASIQQHFPAWKVSLDKLNGNFRDIYGDALTVPGNSIADKAAYCFDHLLSSTGLNKNDWNVNRNTNSPKASYIGFEQSFNGHKVAFSSLSFRFTTDGRLQRIQNRSYGAPGTANTTPTISREDAAIIATQDITDANITGSETATEWVWFPVPSAQGYILHPSWQFTVTGTTKNNLPLKLNGYVDGITGKVVYRSNQVKETVDQTIKGEVFKENPTLPATFEPLANLQVNVNGTNYFTDANGLFTDAAMNLPIVSTVSLQGTWSTVTDQLSGGITPAVSNPIAVNGSIFNYPVIAPTGARHVNAYYHVNRIHDFMKSFFPAFTGMDYSLPTNVDVPGNCNAYYDGSSINFLMEGGGCASFANCGDIIYHEYGHGISDLFYNMQGAGTIGNGALNEGNSDIWGISVTHNPILGEGSSSNGGYIRRYDQAPKVYPTDIEGEVHADGEIIAGAWWDVAVNIGSVDTMTQLFTATYYDTPDGPDGTEGNVYHDVLVSALFADDDDANLSNGTPHFSQIASAFARHGIYLLGDALITHTEVKNQPSNTAITINASLALTNPAYFQKLNLMYRNRSGGQWDSVTLTNTSGLNFTGTIPGQPEGSLMDYYFIVYDFLSIPNVYFPLGYFPSQSSTNSTIPYQFGVGLVAQDSVQFEAPLSGWTIGNVAGDAATAGMWIQAKPVGSYANSASGAIPCQPNADHTFGDNVSKCLVTANASSTSSQIGTADVDGGATTVLTPVFDLTAFTEPVIEYYRWYANDLGSNPGNDLWTVSIHSGTTGIWFAVDRTYKADRQWRRRIFEVSQYVSSKLVQMKFVASDQAGQGQGSIVEAAVDDIFIYDKEGSATGVRNLSASKASIYPNPADDQVRIELAGAVSGAITVNDVTGKEIVRIAMNPGSTSYTVDTRGLTAGIYVVMINTGKSIQTHKITVAH
jgi:Zn-dependent metalloprotease